MQKILAKLLLALPICALLAVSACSPKVGSPEWCADMKEKPKADWTAGEAADFAKNCIL